jgi:hypothetical protein
MRSDGHLEIKASGEQATTVFQLGFVAVTLCRPSMWEGAHAVARMERLIPVARLSPLARVLRFRPVPSHRDHGGPPFAIPHFLGPLIPVARCMIGASSEPLAQVPQFVSNRQAETGSGEVLYALSWNQPKFDAPFEHRRLLFLNGLFLAFEKVGGRAWLRGPDAREHAIHMGGSSIHFTLEKVGHGRNGRDRSSSSASEAPDKLYLSVCEHGTAPPSLWRVRVLRMRDADHAVARLEPGYGASRSDHLARGLAAELLRKRERRAARKLVARQIASAVLHIPARH